MALDDTNKILSDRVRELEEKFSKREKEYKRLLLIANADIFYYSGEKWEYEADMLKLIGSEKNEN